MEVLYITSTSGLSKLQDQSPLPFWLVESRQAFSPSSQSNLENHVVKTVGPQEEVYSIPPHSLPSFHTQNTKLNDQVSKK